MKSYVIYILLISIICWLSLGAQARHEKWEAHEEEQDSVNIDPRQYVKVTEYRKSQKRSRKLWKWSKNKNKQSQIHYIIDSQSKIKISFKKKGIIDNKDFVGNISLSAMLGDKPIEITPYSMVGENRDPIGVKSSSPEQIANNVFELFTKLEQINTSLSENYMTKFIITDKKYLKRALIRLYEFYKETQDIVVHIDSLKWDKTLIHLYNDLDHICFTIKDSRILENYFEKFTIYNTSDIREELDTLYKKSKNGEDIFDLTGLVYGDKLVVVKNLINSCANYFSFVNQSGRETRHAVYGTFGLNSDLAKEIENDLIDVKKIFDFDNISKLSDSKISSLQELLGKLKMNIPGLQELYWDYFKRGYGFIYPKSDSCRKEITINSFYKELTKDTSFKKIRREIIDKIGDRIYSKLVYAIIDLSKHPVDAKSNRLTISVLWYGCKGADSANAVCELPIGSYEVKDVGWNINVHDSFLLINRFGDSMAVDSTLSPSNFKGAPGASLMWSFVADDSDPGIIRFLEPSFGINLSYVDFRTDKDFELGVGFVMGLFRNQVFANLGFNLHSEVQGGYYGVGFSFGNFVDKAKEAFGGGD